MPGMGEPKPIDIETWPRREHFEHFWQAVPCTYSVTVELDATAFADALARSARKTYLAQVWALATVVNRHDEFRMCLTAAGAPAVWDVVHPAITVFNPDRETFACVWARYDDSFDAFHHAGAILLAEHRHATTFFPRGALPPNTFDVSSVPWSSFTGFNLNIDGGHTHLAPILTLGRYVRRDGRLMLPLAIQVHHAAADGYHVSRLVREVQELLANPRWLD